MAAAIAWRICGGVETVSAARAQRAPQSGGGWRLRGRRRRDRRCRRSLATRPFPRRPASREPSAPVPCRRSGIDRRVRAPAARGRADLGAAPCRQRRCWRRGSRPARAPAPAPRRPAAPRRSARAHRSRRPGRSRPRSRPCASRPPRPRRPLDAAARLRPATRPPCRSPCRRPARASGSRSWRFSALGPARARRGDDVGHAAAAPPLPGARHRAPAPRGCRRGASARRVRRTRSSASRAAISAEIEPLLQPSSTITQRRVRATELDDRRHVQRAQHAQVDHLGLDALARPAPRPPPGTWAGCCRR